MAKSRPEIQFQQLNCRLPGEGAGTGPLWVGFLQEGLGLRLSHAEAGSTSVSPHTYGRALGSWVLQTGPESPQAQAERLG